MPRGCSGARSTASEQRAPDRRRAPAVLGAPLMDKESPMGLGLNITSGDGAGFMPHIRYDSRSGRWSRADWSQGADGRWSTELVDISQPPPAFIMDLERIEVGWMSFSSGG